MEIKINSAVNLSDYKSNSLIILKCPEGVIRDVDKAGELARKLSDMKVKWDVDDTTSLWVSHEDFEVSGFDEGEMMDLGWTRSEGSIKKSRLEAVLTEIEELAENAAMENGLLEAARIIKSKAL